MKFETLEISGFLPALHGMRHPLQSYHKNDSEITKEGGIRIGDNDLELARKLVKGGTEHRKFLRQIMVWVDVTAPQYFVAEMDTYKIGTSRNSTSLQHKGMSRPYEKKDFTIENGLHMEGVDEHWEETLRILETLRSKFNQTLDYRYFRMMRQIMPQGYNYTFTWSGSYENVLNMYHQRKHHKMIEWSGGSMYNGDGTPASFVTWAESLPIFKKMCLE